MLGLLWSVALLVVAVSMVYVGLEVLAFLAFALGALTGAVKDAIQSAFKRRPKR